MAHLPPESPFSPLDPVRIVFESEQVIAFYDGFPVSPGHTLVVSKHVTPSIFDLPDAEQTALWQAVAEVRALLQTKHNPTAFNLGLNDGEAAGQTIPHAHIHIIPRYTGDQPDPRGGIRWILPQKAKYW